MSRPTASELIRWGDLDAKRRRDARGLVGLLSWAPVVSAILSALLAADIARRIHILGTADANIGPLAFALIAVVFAQMLVVFGTPYRMYWRHDSALLARLPIDGGALFKLATWRTQRATAIALLPAIAAAITLAIMATPEVGVRLGIVAVSCAALAAMMAPAACLLGGAIVASDKAQSLIDSFGGEFKPPGTAWLGSLPGLVATAVALLAIVSHDWVATAEPFASSALYFCLGAVGLSVVAFAWASSSAPKLLLEAQREVAALDQERLAHIERSSAGPIERLWAGIFARGKSARLIFSKDAALIRRRYPAPFFVAFLGVVAAWICAATSQISIALVIVFSLAAYTAVMARRLATAPVEIPRLLRSLPISAAGARLAKRSAALLRALTWVGASGAAVVVFADHISSAVIMPAAALAFAVVASLFLATEGSHS